MITLYTDRSYHLLFERLKPFLKQDSASIFKQTWLIVPNNSSKQWLQKTIADDLGICAQINFMLPKTFYWQILSENLTQLPANNYFQENILRWQIFQSINRDPQFTFLQKENNYQNFNFAEKIASTLLQYNHDYPQIMQQWQNQKANNKQHWQQNMWQKLLQGHEQQSPINLLHELENCEPSDRNKQAIIIFGVEEFTALQIETLKVIAQFQDIYLFICNPSADYWFDLNSEKKHQKNQFADTDRAMLSEVANSLLANLGSQKQALFDTFLSLDVLFEDNMSEQTHSTVVENSLLFSLRKDIENLQQASHFELLENDKSICIHACHSKQREVAVIKDEILAILNKNPTLQEQKAEKVIKPEEILIVANDINQYVDAIHATFSHDDTNINIPYHINRLQLHESPYVQALLAVLASFSKQMSASVIYDLIAMPNIMQKFNLSFDDLPRINNWIKTSNIRRFFSAQHKTELKFDQSNTNTWTFGKNRWLSGYLAGNVSDTKYLSTYGDIAGQEDLFLSVFDFIENWYALYQQATIDKTSKQWYSWLQELSNNLLYLEKENENLLNQQFYSSLIEENIDCEVQLPLKIIEDIAQQMLSNDNYQSVGKMGIRFQTWSNACTNDIKVLIILGMNDGDFPRKDHQNDLNILQNMPNRLQQSLRAIDKNLLLNALTENHQQLIISYLGYDEKTNEELAPSVLISELLDYLDDKTNGQFKVTRHKMHGFNRKYFQKNATIASYNQQMFYLAKKFYAKKLPPTNEPIALDLPLENKIDLHQLSLFFCDPLDYFLKNHAQIKLDIY
ncbi:MAG TPA: hypothetical protein ENJ44_03905, partial [Oceanospirillales bacterium]|nr:hypothetical protein [Oceanospirillales bacterium]